MPRATATSVSQDKFFLKSCPDGYVVLRRMAYGEYLERREIAVKIAVENMNSKNPRAAMDMAARKTAEYEFPRCIVDHNLTDDNDQPMDFRLATTVKSLDPKIGEEISTLIGRMNNFEEEAEDPLVMTSESSYSEPIQET